MRRRGDEERLLCGAGQGAHRLAKDRHAAPTRRIAALLAVKSCASGMLDGQT
jgi:hypothetical protein